MKIFIGILIILAVYLYNNATANYIFNIFYYQNYSNIESIVKKDINTLTDITHSFTNIFWQKGVSHINLGILAKISQNKPNDGNHQLIYIVSQIVDPNWK